MDDFLTRAADRALERTPVVRPLVGSRFDRSRVPGDGAEPEWDGAGWDDEEAGSPLDAVPPLTAAAPVESNGSSISPPPGGSAWAPRVELPATAPDPVQSEEPRSAGRARPGSESAVQAATSAGALAGETTRTQDDPARAAHRDDPGPSGRKTLVARLRARAPRTRPAAPLEQPPSSLTRPRAAAHAPVDSPPSPSAAPVAVAAVPARDVARAAERRTSPAGSAAEALDAARSDDADPDAATVRPARSATDRGPAPARDVPRATRSPEPAPDPTVSVEPGTSSPPIERTTRRLPPGARGERPRRQTPRERVAEAPPPDNTGIERVAPRPGPRLRDRAGAAASDRTVRVEIGRVEVLSAAPPEPPAPPAPAAAPLLPHVSLDEYLRTRGLTR